MTTRNGCKATNSNLSAERLPLSVEEEGGQNEDDQADSNDRSQLQLLLLLSIHFSLKISVLFQSPSWGRRLSGKGSRGLYSSLNFYTHYLLINARKIFGKTYKYSSAWYVNLG